MKNKMLQKNLVLFVRRIFLDTIIIMNCQYRGRLAELKNLEFVNSKNDLLEAMQCISQTNKGPSSQYPSAGCSIKWKSS